MPTNPTDIQAGPELDGMIDREVMGADIDRAPPKYSTDPAACAEVRTALWKMGFALIRVDIYEEYGRQYVLAAVNGIQLREVVLVSVPITDNPIAAECLAMAWAALKAVRASKNAG